MLNFRRYLTLACLCLALLAAARPATANENEQLLKIIDEFCIKTPATVDQATSRAMKLPYQPRRMGTEYGPPYIRGVALMKLGGSSTLLTFSSAKQNARIDGCEVVSHTQDLPELVAQLRKQLDLPEPKGSSVSVQLRTAGKTTVDWKTIDIQLVFRQEENKPSGSFNFIVSR